MFRRHVRVPLVVLIAFSDQNGSDLGEILLWGNQAVDVLHLTVDALQGFGVVIADQNLKCCCPGNDGDASVGRVDTRSVVLLGLPVGPRGRLSKLAGARRAGYGFDALHDGGRCAVGEVGNLAGVNVYLTPNVENSHARLTLARGHFLLLVPRVLDNNGCPGGVDRRRDAVGSKGPARSQKK